MLCGHKSLRRSVKLQPGGGECRAVGEIAVAHGLRDHGPAQRQSSAPPTPLLIHKEESFLPLRVVFSRDVYRPADGKSEVVLLERIFLGGEEIPRIQVIVA